MKDKQNIIGLMSGTSLDGVDLAYCVFEKDQFSILHAKTYPYEEALIKELRSAHLLSSNLLLELDAKLAHLFSTKINTFIQEFSIQNIDAISSHGHTVLHNPDAGYTLQIANPACISSQTGIKVIGDFRTSDVALGGQGAPLVPIGDRNLFSEFQNRINLGGFANISFETGDSTFAFDICPINILLNEYASKLGHRFDNNGDLARKGIINIDLLNELNSIEFYNQSGPKSLGKEYVDSIYRPLIERFENIEAENILRTLVEHMALQISKVIKPGKSLFTGGGVYNAFLMERIRDLSKFEIVIPDDSLIDFKEALIFAYLGYLRLENRINVLASVTGASRDHISGGIYL